MTTMFILIPYSSLFFFYLIVSVIIVLSAPNWFMAWIAIELNLLRFIPLIASRKSMQETESSVKYFFAQGIGSVIMLIGVFINLSSAGYLILVGLLLKLGAAPLHTWFPRVISGISWPICIITSTWQKIAPLFTISMITASFVTPIFVFASLSALTGGLIGINQSYLRAILAYSRITHTGWILALIPQSLLFMAIYFLIYSLISISVILLLNKRNALSLSFSTLYPLLLFLQLLSLAGLPPLTGFAAKLIALSLLAPLSIPLTIIIILGSLLGLYFYLTIRFSTLFSSFLYPNTLSVQFTFSISLLTIIRLSLFVSLIIFIPFYALIFFD